MHTSLCLQIISGPLMLHWWQLDVFYSPWAIMPWSRYTEITIPNRQAQESSIHVWAFFPTGWRWEGCFDYAEEAQAPRYLGKQCPLQASSSGWSQGAAGLRRAVLLGTTCFSSHSNSESHMWSCRKTDAVSPFVKSSCWKVVSFPMYKRELIWSTCRDSVSFFF